MFGGAAQQLVQSVGLDLAHHNHIHMLLIGERIEHRDRLPFDEMPPVGRHAITVGQFEE